MQSVISKIDIIHIEKKCGLSILPQYILSVKIHPDLGKNYDGITPFLFGIHTNRHIIFDRIINTDTIEITRILRDRMDLKKRIH